MLRPELIIVALLAGAALVVLVRALRDAPDIRHEFTIRRDEE